MGNGKFKVAASANGARAYRRMRLGSPAAVAGESSKQNAAMSGRNGVPTAAACASMDSGVPPGTMRMLYSGSFEMSASSRATSRWTGSAP